MGPLMVKAHTNLYAEINKRIKAIKHSSIGKLIQAGM
jgi:hypothetical protein